MREVSDLFKTSALTTYSLFTDKNSSSGFSIPEYQRIYSWDTKNIDRLFDDIREGILALKSDEDSITFVGTLIFSEKEDNNFQGKVFSVVDGQQRITTLSLMCSILHLKLSGYRALPEELSDEVGAMVKSTVQKTSERLFAMVSGNHNPFPSKTTELYPRVIREEQDKWSVNPRDAYYESPVARYCRGFIDKAFQYKDDPYQYEYANPSESESDAFFLKNLQCIEENISNFEYGRAFGLMRRYDEHTDSLPEWRETIESKKLRTVLLPSTPPIPQETASKYLSESRGHDGWLNRVSRLLSFSNYLMNRVAVTRVISIEDKYAFDIFEALNTAGEPLTALETFKPVVFREEESQSQTGYARSKAKEVFDQLKGYLEGDVFDDAAKRQRESADLIVSFASMLDGRKESLHLGSQRKYLRTRYESLRDYAAKERFIHELGHLIAFKDRFWIERNLEAALHGANDREFALFCAGFIKDMKTTVSIPILARYYREQGDIYRTNEFIGALKATAAFLALWRAYTGGTGAIDSAFRSVMSSYGNKLGSNVDDDRISLDELKGAYKELLTKLLSRENRENDGNFKEAWVTKASQKPLYDTSKPLCKFLLLLSGSDTQVQEGNPHLLEVARPNTNVLTSLVNLRNNEFSTLEHVAPQSPRMDMSWDMNIYTQEGMKSCLGNLILMPQVENSGVGNVGWDRKQIYYRAYSESDPAKLEGHIRSASQTGFEFKEATKELMRRGMCLPTLKSISMVYEWKAEIIAERSRNLMEICWDRLNQYL